MKIPPLQIYLTVKPGKEAIKFYCKAFGAREIMHQDADDAKRVLHSTLEIFGGHIMLSDEFEEFETYVRAPNSIGGTGVTIHVNLDSSSEVDRIMQKALDEGSKITMPAAKQMWGAYYGRLIDPFGHSWSFAAKTTNN